MHTCSFSYSPTPCCAGAARRHSGHLGCHVQRLPRLDHRSDEVHQGRPGLLERLQVEGRPQRLLPRAGGVLRVRIHTGTVIDGLILNELTALHHCILFCLFVDPQAGHNLHLAPREEHPLEADRVLPHPATHRLCGRSHHRWVVTHGHMIVNCIVLIHFFISHSGHVTCAPNARNNRHLDITISHSLDGKRCKADNVHQDFKLR